MLNGRVDKFSRTSMSGWAANSDRPDARVEVVVLVDGQVHGRARCDGPRPDLQSLETLGDGAHGFGYAFDPPLSPLRAYDIKVCHAGTDEPLRLGQFAIAPELGRAAERMRPIIVSLSGQPGCIDLMRLLAGDPSIVAADSHDYGVRLLNYYGRALEVLVMPGGRAPACPDGDGGAYVLTPNPFHGPGCEHLLGQPRLLYDFFQHRSVTPIAAGFKAVVTQFYETLAMHQGKPLAGYFAEQAELSDIARNFARLAFREVREIVLLQDPRDAYCGYRGLWFTTPAVAMATLRRVRDRTIALRRENRQDTLFLRCEDLRSRPETALAEIARFLALERVLAADPQALRAATDEGLVPAAEQWQIELGHHEIVLLEREFADYMDMFGYERVVHMPEPELEEEE